MKRSEFTGFVSEKLKDYFGRMQHKNAEYADDGDSFSNFKAAGDLLGLTPEQALLSFCTKHTISIKDIVMKGELNYDILDEKIGDVIIYHLLLLAMVKEAHGDSRNGSDPEVSSDNEGGLA